MRLTLRWTGRAFIVLGLTMLFFVVYETWGTSQITNRHQSALAKEFDEQLIPSTPSPVPTPSPAARTPIKRRSPVARIVVFDPKYPDDSQRALVNAIVVEGTSIGDLAYGPGHYVETPLPWELGPTGIAGHRTGWSEPFRHIDRLRTGNRITLLTTKGKFNYRVTGSIVVDPEDTWVLNGDPKSKAQQKLVLTTCTPAYTSLRRLIIWADLTSSSPAA